jgi:hypothetical protein
MQLSSHDTLQNNCWTRRRGTNIYLFGAASARTSDPGANIGRVLGHTIRWRESISRRSLRGVTNVANNFCDVAKSFSHVANRRPCNIQRTMLRACCERVPSMLRTRLRATSNIRRLSSPSPTCCDYIAVMLLPVLRATSNIRSPSSPSSFLTQHPTLHVCNIKTQHPQHFLNHSETLRCICRNMLE